jgi:hypothetical protein
MSTADWIQTAIAGVSFLGFVGLIFSLWSLRQATFASVYQGIASQMHDLDKLFVERPDLRPYFYGEEPKPVPHDEPERGRVLATAELIVDFADNFVAQRRVLPGDYERGWAEYFRALYVSSPAVQHFWKKSSGWYCDDLDELLRGPDADSRPPTTDAVPAEAVPA